MQQPQQSRCHPVEKSAGGGGGGAAAQPLRKPPSTVRKTRPENCKRSVGGVQALELGERGTSSTFGSHNLTVRLARLLA